MIIHVTESPSFDSSVDVAIVGAGACGLTAALAARERDATVLVLEQDNQPGGSTGMSYGAICAAGTRMQAAAGIRDSAGRFAEDILAITRGQTDAAMAAVVAENSGPTVDWLIDEHDVALTLEESWTGLGHRQPRLHAPADRSGKTLMAMLLRACERRGIDILTEARVTNPITNSARRVLGLRIRRPDGASEELGCGAAILATCGFGANRNMVRRYIPEIANARYYGHEGNTGDGIRWGLKLGAACADMGSYQALGSLSDPQAFVLPHTLLIGGGVQVNSEGKRFENELDNISGQALTVLAQSGGVCWIVYDRRLHEDALARFQEYRDATELHTARQADSWRELATRCGMEPPALEATMADVDSQCRAAATDEFGRQFAPKQRLVPPYFAARATGALFHTQGGLCVDADARVLTEDGSALPNLFAGGGTARSVSGPGGWGYLPGMGLCMAVTLGRIAGTAAALDVHRTTMT